MSNEISGKEQIYIGNYNEELEKMFEKLSQTTSNQKCLELLKPFSDEIKQARQKKIDEIKEFWKHLERLQKLNKKIRDSKEYREKMPEFNFCDNMKAYINKKREIEQQLGIQELCQYENIRNIEHLFFTYVCSIYGHEFIKDRHNNVKIVQDTTIYPHYGHCDEVTTEDLHVYVHGTQYCQCKLCKQTFDILERPIDFKMYITEIEKTLKSSQKILLNEKKKLLVAEKITKI